MAKGFSKSLNDVNELLCNSKTNELLNNLPRSTRTYDALYH